MSVGRFIGGVGALIWSQHDGKYLLLRRSPEKDFASGIWECVTGRVDQGEGFETALYREVREELGVSIQVEFIIGTTHFFRGEPVPENELIGIIYGCSLPPGEKIQLSVEHSESRWVSGSEAVEMLVGDHPSVLWLKKIITRAEVLRAQISPDLADIFHREGFEMDAG